MIRFNFKKTILLLSSIIAVSSFAACSLSGENTNSPSPAASTPTAAVTQEPDLPAVLTPTSTSTPTPTPTEVPSGFVKVPSEKLLTGATKMSETGESRTPDLKYYFRAENGCIYKINVSDESDKEYVYINYPIIPSYVSGYYIDDDLNECICVTGKGADDEYYSIVYNLTLEKTIYTFAPNARFSATVENGYLMFFGWHDLTSSVTFFRGDTPFAFVFSQDNYYSFIKLNEQYILSYRFDTTEYTYDPEYDITVPLVTEFKFSIFDIRKMSFVASSSILLDSGEDMSYLPYMEGNTIQVVFTDMSGDNPAIVYQWDYEQKPEDAVYFSDILVIDDLSGWAFSNNIYPEGGYVGIEELIPGECIDALSDLRERADEIEKKYDISIYISNECRMECGGYRCTPENNRETVSKALETLDRELEKYPAGFFTLFKESPYFSGGVEFYLAGTLYGNGDGNTLDLAGGFRTEGYRSVIIFVDINDLGCTKTYHHELSHAIESILGDKPVDEDIWLSLSPNKGIAPYTYTYAEWGRGDYSEYILEWDNDIADDCFIDSYSMTYPTEDRARIFENIMVDDSWVDFNRFPKLKEKLRYWAQVIREGIGTDEWPEYTYWERLFKDEN